MLSKLGFTLIELLIVIVIIGLLGALVIGILNPELIIKRTKDAVVKSMIIKIAYVVEANVSATGHVPINEGCTCDHPETCELLTLLTEGTVECHKTQIVSGGTKLWLEVQGVKVGDTLLGGNIDLDDSDAIRYMDWLDGCVAAVSEADPPWVFVWSRSRGFLSCNPQTDIHPGLVTCENIYNDSFIRHNCDLMN